MSGEGCPRAEHADFARGRYRSNPRGGRGRRSEAEPGRQGRGSAARRRAAILSSTARVGLWAVTVATGTREMKRMSETEKQKQKKQHTHTQTHTKTEQMYDVWRHRR